MMVVCSEAHAFVFVCNNKIQLEWSQELFNNTIHLDGYMIDTGITILRCLVLQLGEI
jgi:hypothetical protein